VADTTPTTELASIPDGTQALIDVAQQAVEPHVLEDGRMYAVAVPAGGRVEHIHTDFRLGAPTRPEGTVDFHRAESFSAYVNLHKSPGLTPPATVWADIDHRSLVALFNDHNVEEAGWRDFGAELGLRHPLAWREWTAWHNQPHGQTAFAEFVEDHIPDIVTPTGADLLELAQSFQAVKRATFSSDRRLASGQVQLTYVEEIDATAGRQGTLKVPTSFTIQLAVFEGTDPVQMNVRLRYRINGEGQLQITFILDRPQEVIQEAFEFVVDEVATVTGLPVWFGDPRVS